MRINHAELTVKLSAMAATERLAEQKYRDHDAITTSCSQDDAHGVADHRQRHCHCACSRPTSAGADPRDICRRTLLGDHSRRYITTGDRSDVSPVRQMSRTAAYVRQPSSSVVVVPWLWWRLRVTWPDIASLCTSSVHSNSCQHPQNKMRSLGLELLWNIS